MTRPLDRPLASSGAPGMRWTGEGFRQITTVKDSPSRRPSRVSGRQINAISADLTDYDRAVLHFLADVRVATGQQVARRLWSSEAPRDSKARAARRCLNRLEAWRVLDRLPQRVGGVRGGSASIIYSIGPTGRRLLTRTGFEPRRLDTPGDRYVAHTLSITELVVRLHAADLGGELALLELQTEPRSWRGFLGLMGVRLILKPDMFLMVGSGAYQDRYFIEVDLATERPVTILGKAKRYLAYYRSGEEQRREQVFPRVIWVVPNRLRAGQIAAALRQLPQAAQHMFVIWPFDEVVGRLSTEAHS